MPIFETIYTHDLFWINFKIKDDHATIIEYVTILSTFLTEIISSNKFLLIFRFNIYCAFQFSMSTFMTFETSIFSAFICCVFLVQTHIALPSLGDRANFLLVTRLLAPKTTFHWVISKITWLCLRIENSNTLSYFLLKFLIGIYFYFLLFVFFILQITKFLSNIPGLG